MEVSSPDMQDGLVGALARALASRRGAVESGEILCLQEKGTSYSSFVLFFLCSLFYQPLAISTSPLTSCLVSLLAVGLVDLISFLMY